MEEYLTFGFLVLKLPSSFFSLEWKKVKEETMRRIKMYNQAVESVWTEGETVSPNSRNATWITPFHASFDVLFIFHYENGLTSLKYYFLIFFHWHHMKSLGLYLQIVRMGILIFKMFPISRFKPQKFQPDVFPGGWFILKIVLNNSSPRRYIGLIIQVRGRFTREKWKISNFISTH